MYRGIYLQRALCVRNNVTLKSLLTLWQIGVVINVGKYSIITLLNRCLTMLKGRSYQHNELQIEYSNHSAGERRYQQLCEDILQ